MKIWRTDNGAIANGGTRIIFDEIHENHYYVIFSKGEIVATLNKSENMIKFEDKPLPKRKYPACECDYCKGVK